MIKFMTPQQLPGPILIIEDDPILSKGLHQALTDHGYRCELVSSTKSAVDTIRSSSFPIIVLDLALTSESGLTALRELREVDAEASIIVLTPLEFRQERLTAMVNGADDFVIKPFSMSEVRARIDAISVRSRIRPKSILLAGAVSMDLTTRKVQRGDRVLQLTPTEFRVLEILIRNQGKVVTRRMLCEHLWDPEWEGVTNVIEVHINRLRSKINIGSESQMIFTVRGRGYTLRLDSDVSVQAAEESTV
jgi:two-component system, OmpR family, response regulator